MNDCHRILETLKLETNLNRSSSEELEMLARHGHLVEFDRGNYVFTAGDVSDDVYVVESGKVILSRAASSGKAFTFLVAVRGIPLNAITCFMEKPRLFSARVVERATLVAIPSSVFRTWVLGHPRVTEGILETMGNLLDGTYTRILDLIDQSAEARILNALNMLTRRIGTHLPLTNEDVAEMTGVSRETAARVISHLQKLHLISKARGALEILDKTKIQELSTSPIFIL
jgi:CRP/FNR family transcriptional regulator, nitrogen oxide reductase regulator